MALPYIDINAMSDEEFDAFFQQLTPADQQQIIYQLNYGQSNVPTPAFGSMSPEITPAGFDTASMFAPNPDVDAKGNVEPWDLSNQAQGWNFIQDQMQSLMSPGSVIMGGQGSFDPRAYEPTTTYSGPTVDTATPGRDMVTQLAGMQGNSWDTLLAKDIANGVAPATAVGNLMTLIDKAVDNPDSSDPLTQSVLASLPKRQQEYNDLGQPIPLPEGAGVYDTEALLPYAQDLAMKVASDPTSVTGFEDPNNPGVYYKNAPTTTPSKAAQQFIDAGLPLPTERYSDEAHLGVAPIDIPGYQKAVKDTATNKRSAQERADTAASGYKDLVGGLVDYRQDLAKYWTDKRQPGGQQENAVRGLLTGAGERGPGFTDDLINLLQSDPTGEAARSLLAGAGTAQRGPGFTDDLINLLQSDPKEAATRGLLTGAGERGPGFTDDLLALLQRQQPTGPAPAPPIGAKGYKSAAPAAAAAEPAATLPPMDAATGLLRRNMPGLPGNIALPPQLAELAAKQSVNNKSISASPGIPGFDQLMSMLTPGLSVASPETETEAGPRMVRGGRGRGREQGYTPPPSEPSAFIKNGKWTFGTSQQAEDSQLGKYATGWSPMLPGPLNAETLSRVKKQADQAQYLADRAKHRIGTTMMVNGTEMHGFDKAPGSVERLRAEGDAHRMEMQGRSPLVDAYMQRMMGMRGFGMR